MKKLLKITSIIVIVFGIALVIGGAWGICVTYRMVLAEKIVTPEDATIPSKPVRGPLTLLAEADIIREHTLKTTGGKTFAEMPRQVPKLGDNGEPIIDAGGKPVMVSNTARDIWITATTLMTALNLAVMAYAFSGLLIILGLILIWVGFANHTLSKADKFF